MKKPILIHSIVLAVALPLASFAQDKAAPGKSSDAVKNPPSAAPARSAEPLRTLTDAEPGKASDSVKTPNPAGVQNQFSGAITAVSRDDRTITIGDSAKSTHRLHIGDTTKMKRGDKDATWDDLKVGVKVNGIYSGDEETGHAETINIGG